MRKIYTISVYTENVIGLLNRITIIFTRRHVNIESLSVSHSEIDGVSRFIICVAEEEDLVKKIVGQIEKQVDVISAFYHKNSETVYQEIALYKIAPQELVENQIAVENIIRDANASIIAVASDFMVIEKTGHYEETDKLYDDLKAFGVKQFCRSGRVSISRDEMPVSKKLKEFELDNK